MFTWFASLCFYGKTIWKPRIAEIPTGGLTEPHWTHSCKDQCADSGLWPTSIKLDRLWKTEVSKWSALCKQALLKILQINSKLAILSNLGMPGHTNLKWKYQFKETFDVYIQAKNQLHPPYSPRYIAKILQICYFGYFKYV